MKRSKRKSSSRNFQEEYSRKKVKVECEIPEIINEESKSGECYDEEYQVKIKNEECHPEVLMKKKAGVKKVSVILRRLSEDEMKKAFLKTAQPDTPENSEIKSVYSSSFEEQKSSDLVELDEQELRLKLKSESLKSNFDNKFNNEFNKFINDSLVPSLEGVAEKDLEAKVVTLQKFLEEKKIQYSSLNVENNFLKEELNTKLDNLQMGLQAKDQTVQELQTKVSELMCVIEEKNNSLQQSRESADDVNSARILELLNENKQIKNMYKEVNKAKMTMSFTKDNQIQCLMKELKDKNNEIVKLRDNISLFESKQAIHELVLNNNLRVLKEKDGEMQLLMNDLVIKSDKIKLIYKHNQKKHKIYLKNNQKNHKIYLKNKDLLDENAKLKKIICHHERVQAVENKVLSKYKRDLLEKDYEIQRLMKDFEDKNNEIVKLKTNISNHEEKLANDNEVLNKNIEELLVKDKKINHLTKEIEEKNELRNKVKSMENVITVIKSEKSELIYKHNQKIRKVNLKNKDLLNKALCHQESMQAIENKVLSKNKNVLLEKDKEIQALMNKFEIKNNDIVKFKIILSDHKEKQAVDNEVLSKKFEELLVKGNRIQHLMKELEEKKKLTSKAYINVLESEQLNDKCLPNKIKVKKTLVQKDQQSSSSVITLNEKHTEISPTFFSSKSILPNSNILVISKSTNPLLYTSLLKHTNGSRSSSTLISQKRISKNLPQNSQVDKSNAIPNKLFSQCNSTQTNTLKYSEPHKSDTLPNTSGVSPTINYPSDSGAMETGNHRPMVIVSPRKSISGTIPVTGSLGKMITTELGAPESNIYRQMVIQSPIISVSKSNKISSNSSIKPVNISPGMVNPTDLSDLETINLNDLESINYRPMVIKSPGKSVQETEMLSKSVVKSVTSSTGIVNPPLRASETSSHKPIVKMMTKKTISKGSLILSEPNKPEVRTIKMENIYLNLTI